MGTDRNMSCCGRRDANKGTGSIFQCLLRSGDRQNSGACGKERSLAEACQDKCTVRRGQLKTRQSLWCHADATPHRILILSLFRAGKPALFIFVTL